MTKNRGLSADKTSTHVAIVGTGFAGVAVAVALQRAGYDGVVLLERAEAVGGVWRDNHYPGAACDVQSYLYSYSFAPNTDWTHTFSRQGEILNYLQGVAREHGLTDKIRLGCTVEEARWEDASGHWTLTTNDQSGRGQLTARHLVVATGALADPVVPDIPGLEDFAGESFHTSRWPDGLDLDGKRVAVVGTGASAIQVVPAIQPEVERLTLFQRTPAWVMPRHDREIGDREKSLMATVPGLQLLRRLTISLKREAAVLGFRHPAVMAVAERKARAHLRAGVRDPELRARLTPDYRLGCKRILLSNDYYPALDAPNAGVVTAGIDHVTATGVVDTEGRTHEVDVIVFGTGFKTDGLPLTDRIRGSLGQTMAQAWGESPRAYLGTTVAGFPNAYLMHGPNIGLGHTSVITMFEAQARYVVDSVCQDERRGAPVEPTSQAQADFVEQVDGLTDGTVWTSGGCSSWYLDATGRNSNLWPGSTYDFHRRTRRFREADHQQRGSEEQLLTGVER